MCNRHRGIAEQLELAGRGSVDVAPMRVMARVLAAASLLTACGGSSAGSMDGPKVALAEANVPATDARKQADLEWGATSDGSAAGHHLTRATLNSVDTIVSDMKLMNDAQLAGIPSNYGWATGPGRVMMGNTPRGTNTPSWWKVDNPNYKCSAWWKAVLPWFVVFDGIGNKASNTRVQVRDLKIYILSRKSGTWKLLNHSIGVDGENYSKTLQGNSVAPGDTRTEADGSTSILPPGGSMVFHGWGRGFSDIDGPDVSAIFIALRARLVRNKPSGSDDRSSAKYLIHVGGDYYPDRSTRVSDLAPAYYFPGIGVSRAKLVSNDWQAFNFATIDVGVQDPGGGLSEAQFRSNPPPLD